MCKVLLFARVPVAGGGHTTELWEIAGYVDRFEVDGKSSCGRRTDVLARIADHLIHRLDELLP